MNKDLQKLKERNNSERARIRRVMKIKYFKKNYSGKLFRFTSTMFVAPMLAIVTPATYISHNLTILGSGIVLCGLFAFSQYRRKINSMFRFKSKNKAWLLKYNQEINFMMLKALHLHSISKQTYDLYYKSKSNALSFDNYLTRAETLTSEQKRSLNNIIIKSKIKNLNK